jgi:hypothetical protein
MAKKRQRLMDIVEVREIKSFIRMDILTVREIESFLHDRDISVLLQTCKKLRVVFAKSCMQVRTCIGQRQIDKSLYQKSSCSSCLSTSLNALQCIKVVYKQQHPLMGACYYVMPFFIDALYLVDEKISICVSRIDILSIRIISAIDSFGKNTHWKAKLGDKNIYFGKDKSQITNGRIGHVVLRLQQLLMLSNNFHVKIHFRSLLNESMDCVANFYRYNIISCIDNDGIPQILNETLFQFPTSDGIPLVAEFRMESTISQNAQ